MSGPAIDFVLPGSWRYVPIGDPDAARRVIGRTVEQIAGRSDERAAIRAEIRARFLAAADRARVAGGQAMWICDEIVAGVPLPATITAYWPALAIRTSSTPEEQLAALHDLLGARRPEVEEADLASGGRPAVRRAEVMSGPATDEADAPTVETIEADYFIIRPDGHQVLILSFACGLPTLKEKLVKLFDLIVTTLRWDAAAAA